MFPVVASHGGAENESSTRAARHPEPSKARLRRQGARARQNRYVQTQEGVASKYVASEVESE